MSGDVNRVPGTWVPKNYPIPGSSLTEIIPDVTTKQITAIRC